MVLKVEVSGDLIQGDVDEGYGAVADAFRANFDAGEEIGAACAVYRNGRKVVDLWGGYADGHTGRPWRDDTMVVVFSTTKGMAGAAMAVAHSRGLFELDEPVVTYWPEFAQNGKAAVTVRQLLAHQAGLPVCRRRIRLATAADHERLGEILAAQRPIWEPGTRHGYHSVTLAWYESQLLSRVDPAGRTIGRFFADEVAAPLSASFHIGLPNDVPDERVASIHAFRPWELLFNLDKMPTRMVLSFFNPRGVLSRSMRLVPELMKPDAFNRRDVLAMELPSVNGIGEARAIARIYGDMATGGAPARVACRDDPGAGGAGDRSDRWTARRHPAHADRVLDGLRQALPGTHLRIVVARVRDPRRGGVVGVRRPRRGPGLRVHDEPPRHAQPGRPAGTHPPSGAVRRVRRATPTGR